MAYSQTVAYGDTGTKTSVQLDQSIVPFNASVGITLSSTGSYKLQYSFDDLTVTDANSKWFDSQNIPSGTAASAVTAFIAPIQKVRAVIASNGGTITLQVLQGYTSN